jgi:hypothetical protein
VSESAVGGAVGVIVQYFLKFGFPVLEHKSRLTTRNIMTGTSSVRNPRLFASKIFSLLARVLEVLLFITGISTNLCGLVVSAVDCH